MSVTVPMRILITDSHIAEDPTVAEQLDKLRKQGHEIVVDESLKQYDFVCGRNCWYLKPEVASLFALAIANARRIANADQERIEQVQRLKAAKRKPGATRTRTKTVVPDTGGPSPGTATAPETQGGFF